MVIISMAVMNISMNNPLTTLTPGAREVLTFNVPGVIASMIAAPVIPPKIWAKVRRIARRGVKAPTRAIPRETAGLKRPPETLQVRNDQLQNRDDSVLRDKAYRKKIQALTAREKPKQRAM
jgi:hypothetical protein